MRRFWLYLLAILAGCYDDPCIRYTEKYSVCILGDSGKITTNDTEIDRAFDILREIKKGAAKESDQWFQVSFVGEPIVSPYFEEPKNGLYDFNTATAYVYRSEEMPCFSDTAFIHEYGHCWTDYNSNDSSDLNQDWFGSDGVVNRALNLYRERFCN